MSLKAGLLRPGPKTSRPICCGVGFGNGWQKVDVHGAGKFHASHEQVVNARREVRGDEVLRAKARLLAVRRRQPWIRTPPPQNALGLQVWGVETRMVQTGHAGLRAVPKSTSGKSTDGYR
jgi:hypothetical protein